MFVLVTYDVIEGRTEKFRALLSQYLVHEQNSVFSGTLGKPEVAAARRELARLAVDGDRFLLVTSVNRHNVKVERLVSGKSGTLISSEDIDSSASSVVL